MENINKLIEELNKLKEAKSILDTILGSYNIYSGTIDDTLIKNDSSLNKRIRNYIDFDDSE